MVTTVLLETNGSILLNDIDSSVVKIIDIKTPGSEFGGSFNKKNLEFINLRDEVKFVITEQKRF